MRVEKEGRVDREKERLLPALHDVAEGFAAVLRVMRQWRSHLGEKGKGALANPVGERFFSMQISLVVHGIHAILDADHTVYRRRLSEMLRNSVISRLLLSESSCCDNIITVELRKHR